MSRYTKEEINEMDNTYVIVDFDHYRKGWRFRIMRDHETITYFVSTGRFSKGRKKESKKEMTESAIEHGRDHGVRKLEVRNKDYGRVGGSWTSKEFTI